MVILFFLHSSNHVLERTDVEVLQCLAFTRYELNCRVFFGCVVLHYLLFNVYVAEAVGGGGEPCQTIY